jgi:hypothetical protein
LIVMFRSIPPLPSEVLKDEMCKRGGGIILLWGVVAGMAGAGGNAHYDDTMTM